MLIAALLLLFFSGIVWNKCLLLLLLISSLGLSACPPVRLSCRPVTAASFTGSYSYTSSRSPIHSKAYSTYFLIFRAQRLLRKVEQRNCRRTQPIFKFAEMSKIVLRSRFWCWYSMVKYTNSKTSIWKVSSMQWVYIWSVQIRQTHTHTHVFD